MEALYTALEAVKVEIRAAMEGMKQKRNEAFKKAIQDIEAQCEEGFMEIGSSDARVPPVGDFRLKDTRKGPMDLYTQSQSTDLEMENIVHKELAYYKAGSGMFGSTTAIAMRGEVAPETPYFQQLAIRILSLTCSASGCECNWSVFEQVHTKSRNKLEHKRLHDLVFVKYNQALHRSYNLKDEIDTISLNGIDDCNEWIIGEMDGEEGEDERVHEGDDDLTWRQVYQASGLDEPRQYTRHHKRKQLRSGEGKVGTSTNPSKKSQRSSFKEQGEKGWSC
ncbi:Ribonuclease H-like superfamily [Sesbania bispinosa]|nr:Ribonuclease H-like superfamily [Sesbania bispinosa]